MTFNELDIFKISRIVYAVLKDRATEEEDTLFREWINGSGERKHLIEKLKNSKYLAKVYQEYDSIDWEKDYQLLLKRSNSRKRRLRIIRNCAAAIVALAMIGGIWLLTERIRTPEIPVVTPIVNNVVLTMPNGSEIILDKNTENNIISSFENLEILHTQGGLIYEVRNEQEIEDSIAMACNNLSIPKGMTFDLVLADGTHVWLNAESKLQYPSAFGRNERRVKLEGEGYFEVRSDSVRPFIVEYSGQELTVLGTQFNIYAYPDEQKTLTTLVKGSVSLAIPDSETKIILKPGQQAALVSGANKFIIKEVDPHEISVWRDGLFALDGQTLDEVFRKLSRWYNFEYNLDKEAGKLIFRGNLRAYDEVNIIFNTIERLGQVEILKQNEMINIKIKH